jgi:ParB family chromosome partitioning protein
LARPDFRGTVARRLSEDRDELSPSIISLISSSETKRPAGVRELPVDRIDPNPDQPRLSFDPDTLNELAASLKEHGVLQPILVRPRPEGRYQLIAGERRWRASKLAGLHEIPALVEEIDDETALEIAIIENLQREDLSPLDEALMYDRMTRERGYSIRKLAQKLGKDKGYVENRLRLADAPAEVKQLVSLRKDTLSHAYELLKLTDDRKRRKLAEQVARGELSLVKLRERIEGRPPREHGNGHTELGGEAPEPDGTAASAADADVGAAIDEALSAWSGGEQHRPVTDDALLTAKSQLSEALDDLVGLLREPDVVGSIGETDRTNLAKYLTISKLRLENAIALVRAAEARR